MAKYDVKELSPFVHCLLSILLQATVFLNDSFLQIMVSHPESIQWPFPYHLQPS